MANEDIEGFEVERNGEELVTGIKITGNAADLVRKAVENPRKVTLQKTAIQATDDQGLWVAIRNRTEAISFKRYQEFIENVFTLPDSVVDQIGQAGKILKKGKGGKVVGDGLDGDCKSGFCGINIQGPYAYNVLKLATQAFLVLESGLVRVQGNKVSLLDPELFDESKESLRILEPITLDDLVERLSAYFSVSGEATTQLPYLRRIVSALLSKSEQGAVDLDKSKEVLPYFDGILKHRFNCPSLLELIWSYWHEEGMLVQTMNAIALRFQNRGRGTRDPLANLELDPLRPLNNLIWGFIQDEYNRLTVPRRAYEYDHHYGITLVGKAVPRMETADSRSKFIEGFHNLLYRASIFFREDSDTTVISDGFPLLNALREVHLLLAEGAHNQFGDLPWTARAEMLMMQWFLARTETREFLRGRYMVPYQEPWMGAVDAMNRLQGWTDTTVTHFHELAVTGERVLLSVRYGDWIDINNTEEQARNWARYWKPDIQRYIHDYQAATGVDLSSDMVDTRQAAERYFQPSSLLQKRLQQQSQGRPMVSGTAGPLGLEATRRATLPASSAVRRLPRQRTDR